MPWVPVTDPDELAVAKAQIGNVTVSDGVKGASSADAKDTVGGRSQARAAADALRGLAQVEALNRIVPSGRFAANVNNLGQQLPSGWQSKDVAPFQMLNAASRALLMPSAELQSGKSLGASQINSERELDYWASTIPAANQEPAALRFNVDRIGALAQRRIAQENFNSVWRKKLGNLDTPNARGQTAQQAFEASLASPRMQVLNKPVSQYLTEAQRKRKAATAKKTVTKDGYTIEVID